MSAADRRFRGVLVPLERRDGLGLQFRRRAAEPIAPTQQARREPGVTVRRATDHPTAVRSSQLRLRVQDLDRLLVERLGLLARVPDGGQAERPCSPTPFTM